MKKYRLRCLLGILAGAFCIHIHAQNINGQSYPSISSGLLHTISTTNDTISYYKFLTNPVIQKASQKINGNLLQFIHPYFHLRNQEEFMNAALPPLFPGNLPTHANLAERIFGPGGVRIKAQGSAEISLGLKQSRIQNPSLPEKARNRSFFNFDKDIRLDVQAFAGSKVAFKMNYDTDATFDFDAKKIKLAYTGEEDEIIKSIEAGNVSMATGNSLIKGGAALFGLKADLQFGKLRLNTLFAQQKSKLKTINSKGNIQTQTFELAADQYDENRHFFLSYYFRDTYETSIKNLPAITSGIKINKIEVWITNKQGSYEQVRNLIAFSDLAEHKHIHNKQIAPTGNRDKPYNQANTLYTTLTSQYPDARNIELVNQLFDGFLTNGTDYEKVDNARMLSSSEYILNSQLGYISLQTRLQAGESLGVAYSYTDSEGQVHQVGEFATDHTQSSTACLYVKLLKGTSLSPQMPYWNLMMKNIYSLEAHSIQKDKFNLQILYRSDTTGTYRNSLPEGNRANEILLRVMNLDNLDKNNERRPDGFFDFMEGYTILSENGKIIFPSVEPFGSYLQKQIGNHTLSGKYIYQELYDSTLTVARQIAEKNKFILRGTYKAASENQISLGTNNIPPGSVHITANGRTLSENTDYIIDYTTGTVTILNEEIKASGTPVSISLDNQADGYSERKTMIGLDLTYRLNRHLTLGATLMHLSERPSTIKTSIGNEGVNNTLWGSNLAYKGENRWLTRLANKIPLLHLTKPSRISFNAEFAHLIAGHYQNKETGDYSYLDDFEATRSYIDLKDPYFWQLSSVPYQDTRQPLFPEATSVNDINYGKNRALLAWYSIDELFTREHSSLRPKHIDKEQLSNHYIRAVQVNELFPQRQLSNNENNTLKILNLAYYPAERGPYNLDADNINTDGTLLSPEKRFGGIMRKIEPCDFEVANIEYIEFWLMDPFMYNAKARGGDLYLNLGEISEDILKDGKKFFENGLPVNEDTEQTETTVWGKVPKLPATLYAFDNTSEARNLQDAGLNGLSSEAEATFETYAEYLRKLRAKLSAETLQQMENDPFRLSPFHDPAGDKYHYFRGSDYDREKANILTRYKRYNGTEGNSRESGSSNESYNTSAKSIPDIEDINQDYTLNEHENYFEYKISIRPADTVIGTNFISDKRVSSVKLPNNTEEEVRWFQFKIPVKQYSQNIGNIQDFKSIRFMRLYMTDFSETTILRLASLQLVRGEWRVYEQNLSDTPAASSPKATVEVSTVSYEENSDRKPVNYVLPPDVDRIIDTAQPQLRQENEQSLSLKVTNLYPADACAVYKNVSYDLRRYERLQLFVHAEKLPDDITNLNDNELTYFIRIGSDYKNNYYEYEVPLTLTPHGQYTLTRTDREAVWQANNRLDIPLNSFITLKTNRSNATLNRYSEQDPGNTRNKISVSGNPSLSDIRTIMLGIRNRSSDKKDIEVWFDELRLTGLDDKNGWAANTQLHIVLSDLATFNIRGQIETAGFGALDQSVYERRMEDFRQYHIATSIQLGKFFPDKVKASIPLYYSCSNETYTPEYNPFDPDIPLKNILGKTVAESSKDSIYNYVQDRFVSKSISLNNIRIGIKSKIPKPYDPANFSIGYTYNVSRRKNPQTEYENTKDYHLNFNYNFVPAMKPIKLLSVNPLPSIYFRTELTRNYYEQQLRDLEGLTSGTKNDIPVTFSQNFYWDRAFRLNWQLFKDLNFSFSSGTNARIEEPHMQVNKQLNPDQYQLWKDSVLRSIADLGTPIQYDQQMSVTWQLPFRYSVVTHWIQTSVNYQATYNWYRGADTGQDIESGNTVKNQRQFQLNSSLNFAMLYPKKVQGICRFLTMLRRLHVRYTHTAGMMLTGFRPEIGDIFGQGRTTNGLAPGIGFAFGSVNRKYIVQSLDKGWLIDQTQSNQTPALLNKVSLLEIRTGLEPVSGLKIELQALRNDTRNCDIYYMYKDMPEQPGGNFSITTVALGSALRKSGCVDNNYTSSVFNRFLENRETIARRLEQKYTGQLYPDKGFIHEQQLGKHPYHPGANHENGVNPNSADVLIPAFLAAYTGQNPDKIKTSPFPSVFRMLPNWRITYNGLSRIPAVRKYIRSITLSHQYRCSYSVGAYSSFPDWLGSDEEELGYIQSLSNGKPVPSSPYDIPSVSITESFSPLLGIDISLLNHLTFRSDYTTTRNLGLNITSCLLVESFSRKITIGLGYKLTEFNRILRIKSTRNFSNDLTARMDFSFQRVQSLIRRIQQNISQAVSGSAITAARLSVDYGLSRSLTVRAFYDLQINKLLVTSGAYPTSDSNYGISLRFSLAQ